LFFKLTALRQENSRSKISLPNASMVIFALNM